jgi:TolB-like protein/Flp pilus assembly protein TadD
MEKSLRSAQGVIRFGAFELTPHGELRRDGTRIRLQEQPLQILRILLQEPGRIISRQELRQRIWPAGTFVDFDHGINNAIKRLRTALGDTAETALYIQTLPRRGYRFIGNIERETLRLRSLAVLPLENISGDPEQEYFADGLTEALITTLARIGQLRVIARTSSILYKGARKSLREIARELEADTVIEGTVTRSGSRVRITAQLIDGQNQTHLWAESYERDLSDVLTLQAQVAQAIAHEVQVTLTPQEQAHLAQTQPVDPEAYEAYLRGRYHWNRRSRDAHEKAIYYFRQAIAKDPFAAPAYAGLADTLQLMGLWGLLPPEEGMGEAKRLALIALEKDPGLADAHCSLAWAMLHYDRDFQGAEREFERALELNPRHTMARQWWGMTLSMMGRKDEAYTEFTRAVRLEPHWSLVHWGLAFFYWCERQFDRAIDECNEALELDPHSPQGYVWLGIAFVGKRLYTPAIAALQTGVDLSQRAAVPVAFLGEAYAASGATAEADKILLELTGNRHVTAYLIARIYVALGKIDEAFRWLETAYQDRAEWIALLKVDPRLDDLRQDVRYQDLMRRLHLADRE